MMVRSPNQHARRTTRLSYDEIATRCSNWLLCVAYGETGPHFWPAWKATASSEDLAHAVSWEEGIELLAANGLTIGIDRGGYAHIRFVNDEQRQYTHKMKRLLEQHGIERWQVSTYPR